MRLLPGVLGTRTEEIKRRRIVLAPDKGEPCKSWNPGRLDAGPARTGHSLPEWDEVDGGVREQVAGLPDTRKGSGGGTYIGGEDGTDFEGEGLFAGSGEVLIPDLCQEGVGHRLLLPVQGETPEKVSPRQNLS